MLGTLIKLHAVGHVCAVEHLSEQPSVSEEGTSAGEKGERGLLFPPSLPPSPFLSLSVKQGHRLLEDPELSAKSHAVGIHSVTASALIHLYTSVCIYVTMLIYFSLSYNLFTYKHSALQLVPTLT